jgi:DNA-binding GntR family transcriptional regulator
VRLVDANQVLHRQSNSLSEEAYSKIRSMIISLDLEPGSLINEAELMVRLGFSRTPIREALRSLASEKLVQVYPRRGSRGSGD